ncbi:aminotransferase class I/II-fold pyridoxal phosphate-dependent enzyme [Streptomyces albiaxialis]|uniref:aminotransferase class I/II-fold pyridoxal phosphate-dependent enzyme n=1 Tax=Streptomyces albiaxialis TaxID=329523 RepID=UPI0031E2EAC6
MQHVGPAGFHDLGPGYPDPELIPTNALRGAFATALDRYGDLALRYGHDHGALPFREAVAEHLSRTEAHPWSPEQLLVTPGTSQMLDTVASALSRPGDVVLAEAPTYDLALRIFRDRGLDVAPVHRDRHGPVPGAIEEAVRTARRSGRRAAFVYLVPTFHNPTGTLIPLSRRAELIDAARGCGLTFVEDDAYADLAFDGLPTPPSLAALAGQEGVIRLGTFSKTLAPGLRLGWLGSSARRCRELAGRGVVRSGGAASHLPSLAVAGLLGDGRYDTHLRGLREHLAERRNALVTTLRDTLGQDFTVPLPPGGLFAWIGLPPWLPETEAVSRAAEAGVLVQPGSPFGSPTPAIRLAYSATPPTRLHRAAHALAGAWTLKDG